MVINLIEKKKQARYVKLILILVAVTICIVLWQTLSKGGASPSYAPPVVSQKINIDWQILENPEIEALQPFDSIEPFEGEAGRDNPFIPY